jgi:heat shock protein HslJ
MLRSRLAVSALLAMAFFAARTSTAQAPAFPTTPPAPAQPPLEGTAWALSELPGLVLHGGRSPTLRFTRKEALGFDGCNPFRETYTMLQGVLQIEEPFSSLIECPAEKLQQVGGFRSAIGGARSYRIEGPQLRLLTADGGLLATLTAQPAPLAGTAWRATDINTGRQAVSSVLADTTVTLEFTDDAKASGSGGCNRYTAGYRRDGALLSFQAPTAKRKTCKNAPLMAQEESFLKALATVASARVVDDRLELRSADGTLAVQLTRAAKR